MQSASPTRAIPPALAVGALLAGALAWLDSWIVSRGADPPLAWHEQARHAAWSAPYLLAAVLSTLVLGLGWRAWRGRAGRREAEQGRDRPILGLAVSTTTFWIVFFAVFTLSEKDRWWWKAALAGIVAGLLCSTALRRLPRSVTRGPGGIGGRASLLTLGVVAWSALVVLPAAGRSMDLAARPPVVPTGGSSAQNFILIVVDTLRADHLGVYGYGRPTTPRMDAIAARGVAFRNVVSPASWTFPAVASIMTSTYPGRHGAYRRGAVLPRDMDTLAAALRRAGYRTAGFASNPWLEGSFGLDAGFDEYLDQRRLTLKRRLWGIRLKNLVLRALDRIRDDPERLPRAPEITERAERWLHRAGSGPFFLYLHYMDVHHPYLPPGEFRGTFCKGHDFGVPDHRLEYRFRIKEVPGTADLIEHFMERYDEDLLATDTSIGHLVQELDAMGLAENTHVIITSDHGEEFYEHGGTVHRRTLYQEVIRVPLIWLPPRTAGGGGDMIDEPVTTMDIFPTLLEIAGVPPPDQVQGESLAHHLWMGDAAPAGGRERSEAGPRLLGSQLLYRKQILTSLITGDAKLIRIQTGTAETPDGIRFELYRLDSDAAERRNLAAEDPAGTRLLADLLERAEGAWGRTIESGPDDVEAIDEETLEQLKALGYVE